MKRKEKYRTVNIVDAQRLLGFLSSSFDDYIASRILFNNNKLIQGCVLANTAIEKYFKAIIEFRGNRVNVKHDLVKLLPSIKNFDEELHTKLNKEFLEQLSKIYETRYIGDCPVGYNIVIIKRKYLAELDYTFSVLEPSVRWKLKTKDKIEKSKYEHSVESNDALLYQNNYVLQKVDKTQFIESVDMIHELRVYSTIIEVIYFTKESKNDGEFRYEALIPKGDHHTFNFSHKPITLTAKIPYGYQQN